MLPAREKDYFKAKLYKLKPKKKNFFFFSNMTPKNKKMRVICSHLYKARLVAVMASLDSHSQNSPEESADWTKPWLGPGVSMSATLEQTEGSSSAPAIQSLTSL